MNRRGFLGALGLLTGSQRMSTINQPDTMSSIVRELDRRIRILETAQRVNAPAVTSSLTAAAVTTNLTTAAVSAVGTGRIISANGAVNIGAVTISAWENTGATGSTWADTAGNTGTGYPQVTITTGRKALIIVSGIIGNCGGTAATYQATGADYGVGWNSLDPSSFSAGGGQPAPHQLITETLGSAGAPGKNMSLAFARTDLTPGVNVFKLWSKWQSGGGAGAIQPSFLAPQLTIIPID